MPQRSPTVASRSPLYNRSSEKGPFTTNDIGSYFDPGKAEVHHHYSLFQVKKGLSVMKVDGHEFHLRPNTVHLIKPGQSILLLKNEIEIGNIISFSPDFLALHVQGTSALLTHPLLVRSVGLPFCDYTVKSDAIIEFLIEQLRIELACPLEGGYELIGGLLRVLMLCICRKLGRQTPADLPSKHKNLVNQFFRLLERDFISRRMVSQYAAALGISASYLNEIVKITSGFTAGYHIRQRIILEAKRMAMKGDTSMKEIAYDLGFCDPAHFSKCFKNCTGQRFSDFRKALDLI